MDINNIENWYSASNSQILKKLGKRLQRMRLNKNMTQEHLARDAGLDRSTISELENGRAATILTLIKVLRALENLELLEAFDAEPEISPIEYMATQNKVRERASPKKEEEADEFSEW